MPAQPKSKKKSGQYHYANGKRKTSVARVRLFADGQGAITINEKTIDEYCAVPESKDCIIAPLKLTGLANKFDITVKITGGGPNSQVEACRHGISKALLVYDELLRPVLKKAGFLTRDSRMKERKKFGLKRARKAPQFSKR